MRIRTIGTSNIKASVVALGTWAIGGGQWWGESDDQQSVKAIQSAIDAGITMIDTAPVYGFGRSEQVVAEAIKGRRDKVVLATKCGLWWHDERGVLFFERDGHQIFRTLSPEAIRQEVELSLQRLETDYIDLYQTHWQSLDPAAEPIAETMECLTKLKEEGKIRAIGASNVNVEQIIEYRDAGVLDAVQPRYSMLVRKIELNLLPYCRKHKVSTLVYSPLEYGLLTGKIGMDRMFQEGEVRHSNQWFEPENRQRVLNMLDSWKDLTEKYDCSLSQLVIAWTVEQPGVTFALCGARKPEHASENAAAGDIVLDADVIVRMRRDAEALGSQNPHRTTL